MVAASLLIVDDDAAIRESFGDYFEDHGYQVQLHECAETALSSLQTLSCDLAIVDIRLGGMPGDEFIYQAHAVCHQCGFIICTGSPAYQMPAGLIALERVSSNVFQKPVVDLAELEHEVRRMLERLATRVVGHGED